jgi:two-component system, NarL family, invasion response regulator UvrY
MKILLVDDHTLVREGVRRLLSGMQGAMVFEAATGQEALAIFREERPEVVLLDLNLSGIGGLELLRRMLAENEKVRIVVTSMHAEPVYVARALRLGARGYVSKSARADELVTAVKRVAEGGRYVEREIAGELAFAQIFSESDDPLQRLSTRELEILRLLGEGNSLTEIAQVIGVAYKTVANTCSIIKSKVGVERTADLIRLSMELTQEATALRRVRAGK